MVTGWEWAVWYLLVPAGLQAALARQVVKGGAVQQRPLVQRVALRQLLCACTLVQQICFLAAQSRAYRKPNMCAICRQPSSKGHKCKPGNPVNLITPDSIFVTHMSHP